MADTHPDTCTFTHNTSDADGLMSTSTTTNLTASYTQTETACTSLRGAGVPRVSSAPAMMEGCANENLAASACTGGSACLTAFDAELTCFVCTELFVAPVRYACQRHVTCAGCAMRWLSNAQQCPFRCPEPCTVAALHHDTVLEQLVARRESAMDIAECDRRQKRRDEALEKLKAAVPRNARRQRALVRRFAEDDNRDDRGRGRRRLLNFHPLHILISRLVLPGALLELLSGRRYGRKYAVSGPS
ncbi:hypothetical protein NFJ02_13g15210 [Pycnococcus provasolii]